MNWLIPVLQRLHWECGSLRLFVCFLRCHLTTQYCLPRCTHFQTAGLPNHCVLVHFFLDCFLHLPLYSLLLSSQNVICPNLYFFIIPGFCTLLFEATYSASALSALLFLYVLGLWLLRLSSKSTGIYCGLLLNCFRLISSLFLTIFVELTPPLSIFTKSSFFSLHCFVLSDTFPYYFLLTFTYIIIPLIFITQKSRDRFSSSSTL